MKNIETFSNRAQLKHEFAGLHLIEASAGTGKTFTITNLYLRALLLKKIAVKNILVVTFTKAATADLKIKIYERLLEFKAYFETADDKKPTEEKYEFFKLLIEDKNKDDLENIKNRLNLALMSMNEMAVSTIHGFCQRVLKQHSFLSDSVKEMEVVPDKDKIIKSFITDWWRINVISCSSDDYNLFKAFGWSEIKSKNPFADDFTDKINRVMGQNLTILPTITDQEFLESKQKYCDDTKKLQKKLQKEWDTDKVKDKLSATTFIKGKPPTDFLSCIADIDDFLNLDTNNYPIKAFDALGSDSILKKNIRKNKELTDVYMIDIFKIIQKLSNYTNDFQAKLQAYYLKNACDYVIAKNEEFKKQHMIYGYDDILQQLNNALKDKQSGTELAKNIMADYPIAFIDEFQDTDNIQYNIFKNIYFENPTETSLYLIGDPKQAIYQFRGADVFTYMQAKKDIKKQQGQFFTLATNYRSTDTMIKSVNSIFNQNKTETPFLFEEIPFEKVKAPQKDFEYLTYKSEPLKSLHFITQNNGGTEKVASKKINQAISSHIKSLLNDDNYKIGDEKVKASDIAILVNSGNQATELVNILRENKIYCIVDEKKNNVFDKVQADHMLFLMVAVNNYDNIKNVNNLIACGLFGWSLQTIKDTIDKPDEMIKQLKELKIIWQKYGFLTMFFKALTILKLSESLAQQKGFDRKYHSLLQIAQLIDDTSKPYKIGSGALAPPIVALKNHTSQGGAKAPLPRSEITYNLDKQIRAYQQMMAEKPQSGYAKLATDKDLIQIFTVHHAKGLQYKIVFLPCLWLMEYRNKKANAPIIYHQDDNKRDDNKIVYDFTPSDKNQEKYKKEQQAEEIRKLYVAITRAETACFVYWHYLKTAKENPLQQIISHDDDFMENIKGIQIDEITKYENIKPPTSPKKINNNKLTLPLTKITQKLQNFQRKSYTSLSPEYNYEKHKKENESLDNKKTDEILQFKKGADTGDMMHKILEWQVFNQDIKKIIENNQSFDLSHNNKKTIIKWVQEIGNTKLTPDNLVLNQLKSSDVVSEMEFNFAIDEIDINRLNQYFDRIYNKKLANPITKNNFCGLITGSIDLIFLWNGKYYLADYKTNFIGDEIHDYNKDKMQEQIIHHRYDLQYTIYSIALHRYLKNIMLDAYDYNRHFGGVFYLFVRAMRQNNNNYEGVFFDKIKKEQIFKLEDEIFK